MLVQTEPPAVLIHEIRRCLRRYDGVDTPLERVRRRIGVPVLLLRRALRRELHAGIRDVPLEGAHAIHQCTGERDRVVQRRPVDPGESPILEEARVHDRIVAVTGGWQSWKRVGVTGKVILQRCWQLVHADRVRVSQ